MVLIHLNVIASETCLFFSSPYRSLCTQKHTCILIFKYVNLNLGLITLVKIICDVISYILETLGFYLDLVLYCFSLRSLDMSSNEIQYLPSPAHWKSLNLRELLFSHNQISILDLSEKAYAWSRVEKLHLSHNKLKEVRGHLCLKLLPIW